MLLIHRRTLVVLGAMVVMGLILAGCDGSWNIGGGIGGNTVRWAGLLGSRA